MSVHTSCMPIDRRSPPPAESGEARLPEMAGGPKLTHHRIYNRTYDTVLPLCFLVDDMII
jgi:hypothetical protein